MKSKRKSLSTQLLVMMLAALVLGIMLQMAQAQVIQIDMPQSSFWKNLSTKTTFNYYHQFLGPTVGGASGETYNVFQEGRINYQSYHAANLRYQINSDWAVGGSIAAVNAYGDNFTDQNTGFKGNNPRDEFFNARAYISVPSWKTKAGTLFSTFAYEAPTSTAARNDDMRFGLVVMQSFAFKLPSAHWSSGLAWQYYRAYYKENIVNIPADFYFEGSRPEVILRQTSIVSGGPYLNYNINDRWMWNNSITFDWDQRGNQTSSRRFNNNLPDRARTGITYYPAVKYLASVGVFTQALLKYSQDTHAVGGEFALKF